MALLRSSANQNPLAALKQRIALVHPLANALGLLSILRNFIGFLVCSVAKGHHSKRTLC